VTAPPDSLWERVVGFGGLLRAFRRAFRGNRRNPAACRLHLELEPRLLALSSQLRQETYTPEPYRYFWIRHPKRRLISVASFRDRVVHHALVGALEPLFERRFIRHSYACRRGKGTHRALRQARRWCARFPYCLKTDIDSYFASIRHESLLRAIASEVTDPLVLRLCRRIIGNARLPTVPPGEARGLPIGNLTSQFWANVYLDPLDHHVRDARGMGAYLRYMDDILIFDHRKERLWQALSDLRGLAGAGLGLRVKDSATRVAPTRDGVSFLGMRVYPAMVRLDHSSARRLARAVRDARRRHDQGLISHADAATVLQSAAAHAGHAASRSFLRGVLARVDRPHPGRP